MNNRNRLGELLVPRSELTYGRRQGRGISWLLILLLLGSTTISYHAIPGVSYAQLIWALALVAAVLVSPVISRTILRSFGGFVSFALLSTLAQVILAPKFGYHEGIKSCANLLFFFGCSMELEPYVRRQGFERIYRAVAVLVHFLAASALFQYIYVTFAIGSPDIYVWPSFIGNPYNWRLKGHFRAAGIFGEPSWLGLYIVLLLAFLMVKPPSKWPLAPLISGSLGVLISFSAGAYALLFVLLVLQLPRFLLNIKKRRTLLILTLFTVLALSSITVLGPLLWEVVVSRFSPGELLLESSARDRLVGSWELAAAALRRFPLAGVGLGNLETFFGDIAGELQWKMNPTGKVASAFAYVLGGTGIIGTLLFLYAVWQTCSIASHLYGTLVYMTTFWLSFLLLWNFLLAVPFWLFLVLGISILPSQKKGQYDRLAVRGRTRCQ